MFNPFTASGLFYHNPLDRSVSNNRVSGYNHVVFIITMFYRNSYNKCSVDPDQILHSAATDLGLHCLPITLMGFLTKMVKEGTRWLSWMRV